MRLIFILSLLSIIISKVFSQHIPQGMSYQAIASKPNGMPFSNTNISIRFTIKDGSPNGTTLYEETHATTTDKNGLFSLVIGAGSYTGDKFESINWSSSQKYLVVEIDETGSNGYKLIGSTQLLSVPYAFHALSADNVDDADADPNNELVTAFQLQGTNLVLTDKGGNKSVDLSQLSSKWKSNEEGIYRDGNVRIGKLNLGKQLNVTNKLRIESDGYSGRYLEINYTNRPDITTPNDLVFNNHSFEVNLNGVSPFFGVKNGITSEDLFFVKQNGNIGVGTNIPAYKLDVKGQVNADDFLIDGSSLKSTLVENSTDELVNDLSLNGTTLKLEDKGGIHKIELDEIASKWNREPTGIFTNENTRIGNINNAKKLNITNKLRIDSDTYSDRYLEINYTNRPNITTPNDLVFNNHSFEVNLNGNSPFFGVSNGTSGEKVFFVKKDGFVGIGNVNPKAKVHITAGDVYIESVNSGVIMKSPNGKCWRMTVNDTGNPVFTNIQCP